MTLSGSRSPREDKPVRTKTIFQILVAAALLFQLAQPGASSKAAAAAANYKITFVNVGQGDAALLVDPNGFAVLVDGGKSSAGPGLVDFIRSQGIADIDVMVATHPDSDHIGGLLDVLQMDDVPVLSVLYNGYPGTTQTWTNFVNAVQAEGAAMNVAVYPQTLAWGLMSAVIINPEGGLSNPDSNDACLAFQVQTGAVKTLFTCDLDSAQEAVVLARGVNIDSDILKVAHHGSGSSSSQAFIDAVTPKDAVISVGDNSYGHPDPATIARLEDAGARVWRTDVDGNITVLTDGLVYAVNQDLPAAGPRIYLPIVVGGAEQPAGTDVQIGTIFYDGVEGSSEPDEYVEIVNHGAAVELDGWTLSDNQGHIFTFPGYEMQPDQVCRVYTNQDHPEWCGFNYGATTPVWNNSGDCAILKNALGQEVSKKCYP